MVRLIEQWIKWKEIIWKVKDEIIMLEGNESTQLPLEIKGSISCCAEMIDKLKIDIEKKEVQCPCGMNYINNGIVSQTLENGRIYEFEIEYEEKECFSDYCTLKNISEEAPPFPLGEIAGRYERLPLNEGDIDGGLRLKGKYKKDYHDKPLITYVTVVYNRIDTLPVCMESIWKQDYDNIEYIVVDGGSTDGTLEFLKAHEEHIDYFVSQKDKGIYNAMNKGISLASGRYICFINSDDVCKLGAASIVAGIYNKEKPLLIAGRREMMNDKGKIIKEIPFPRYRIHKEAMFPLPVHHQSVYAQRSLFDEIGYYDESFKFIADYKWEITCITRHDNIFFAEEELSVFSIGGLTGTANPIKRWDEWTRLSNELFPEITYKQAEILHYAVRHFWQYCEVKTLVKSVGNKLQNVEFARTLYETCWYICQIELIYLQNMIRNTEENYQDQFQGLYQLFEEKGCKKGIPEIQEWIDRLQKENEQNPERKYEKSDFEFVNKVKHEINICYHRVRLERVTGEREIRKSKRKHKMNCIAARNGYFTLYVAKKQFRR